MPLSAGRVSRGSTLVGQGEPGSRLTRRYERRETLLSHNIETPRRLRSDGERSRRLILHAATGLATVEGLRGLSIADLARRTGMSKSGLFAHFRSKEELQLATVAAAAGEHDVLVVQPALRAPTALGQLQAVCHNFLELAQRSEGGCFFASASAELDTHPGRVRDSIRRFDREWMTLLTNLVAQAQAAGDLPDDLAAAQLAFEVRALLHLANTAYQLHGDQSVIDTARRGLGRRLGAPGSPS
ncbi:TetR family transcriptional regulator C-terminal domain-containing protein [Micromonospora sp. NPDC048898]|uniref:TetR family transcriptional regulator C-terminal domain-containing protein n=1 Tax=Micromonospora sp. NPDC048898 TaxID=3364260 RepID=UPI00371AA6B4